MSIDFHVVIPARFNASRLPGKLLMEIAGLTVLERVYRQALKANPTTITIATDSVEIAVAAEAFGAPVQMTSSQHASGTDRIAEVVAQQGIDSEAIIVNVQGDEPFIKPILIQQVAQCLSTTKAPMATLCWPIEDEKALLNPHVVKVVRNCQEEALYFSRSPIPATRDPHHSIQGVYRHIGLYAYRAGFLLELVKNPVCELESKEALEQLRALWLGHTIKVPVALEKPLQDINTEEDLQRARSLLSYV